MNRFKNSKSGRYLTSQEVVERFGITYQTLCYYTDIGLFQVAGKGGHKRYYDKEHIAGRLARIRELQSKDYSLKSIRSILLEKR